MVTRIISAIIGIPILLVLVSSGGIILKISAVIFSIIGMSEFYKALSNKVLNVNYLGYIFSTIFIVFLGTFDNKFLMPILTLFILSVFIFMVFYHKDINIKDALITIGGFFYIPFLLSNIYLIREHHNGIYFVWLVFISAWLCDTGAYFVGVSFGKHKLIPSLSPNKTIEGSIGGVAFATVSGFIYGLVISKIFSLEYFTIVPSCTIITFLGSLFAQLGDLTASSIKRYTKIKDFGKIMPGHGGFIDRFDSVLFTAPIIYIIIIAINYF